ncbi:hypothetical protein [Spirosoma agri]|uniref:Uncharacterized protein n=1 Tax=Spirosoma agri TaxID=1987381 RepID=A0A6M0II73_9BACT|nr:hypothetical protein [Spirosoma agri]NEU67966.1 hypothetical protein [Spirosoma agri]
MAPLPSTDIELGKWYPATLIPPDLHEEQFGNDYSMILGIDGHGSVPGCYFLQKGMFYWHCERYGDFDDEAISGWTRAQEINNNIEWETDVAKDVSGWMIIADVPKDFETIQTDAVNSFIGGEPSNDEDDFDDQDDDPYHHSPDTC